MIYQPRNVQPSGSAIDVLLKNTFSMEMQTNTSVVAYKIYVVNFNNQTVYEGNKTTLATPAYNGDKVDIVLPNNSGLSNGNNYKWRVRLYQDNADMMITYGLIQSGDMTTTEVLLQANINIKPDMTITIGEDTRTIASYDVSTGKATLTEALSTVPTAGTQYNIYSDFIETVPDYIFYARKTPVVTILDVPTTITQKYHTFQGQYQQENNVPIAYHVFELYLVGKDDDMELLANTEKVYSAKLQFEYDAFRTGNKYALRLTVENDMGIIVTTPLYTFSVTYDIIEYLQQPLAVFDYSRDANRIAWTTPVEHDGILYNKATGKIDNNYGNSILLNVPYTGVNSLYTKGNMAEWTSPNGLMEVPEQYNVTLQFSPDENFFYNDNGAYTPKKSLIIANDERKTNFFTLSLDGNTLLFEKESGNLSTAFYTGTTNVFLLTTTGQPKANEDYVWDDTGTWNDALIWTEGGTPIGRICNHWWKVRITNTSITVKELVVT